MTLPNQALVLDLIEWIGDGPRPYTEVMKAWRTSCPRLTVWEDAVDASLVRHEGRDVKVTSDGQRFLSAHRPIS
ncbi:MAG TPA: hypothetical protein VG942_00405 [Hyphomonadaceae bacterium]|nr:hypothetical protein [Hyphomonadaceae bacterium]